MTPPNFGSGGGSCFPEIVVVAPGEPGVPVVSGAFPGAAGFPSSAPSSDETFPVAAA